MKKLKKNIKGFRDSLHNLKLAINNNTEYHTSCITNLEKDNAYIHKELDELKKDHNKLWLYVIASIIIIFVIIIYLIVS